MMIRKSSVAHFSNLNSSSINKPFLDCGPLNMLFYFFPISYFVYFNDAFVKKFMKNLSFFNTNF